MRFKSFFSCLVLCFFFIPAFAQSESVSIVTYYPSPYGVYNQIEVRRGVIYSPLSSVPDPSSFDREGEMVYVDDDTFDSIPGQLYIYGGGSWGGANMGGGSGGAISLKCPDSIGRPGTPAACPEGWEDAGTGSVAMLAGSAWPQYYGYSERWCYKAGVTVVSLKCPAHGVWSSANSACEPPACPEGWTEAGTGCIPYQSGPAGYYGTCERWCYK